MQTHHKLMILAIVFSLILLIFGERCAHALSDFAGQGKAPLSWNDIMIPKEDPSRVFAVSGGHGVGHHGGHGHGKGGCK